MVVGTIAHLFMAPRQHLLECVCVSLGDAQLFLLVLELGCDAVPRRARLFHRLGRPLEFLGLHARGVAHCLQRGLYFHTVAARLFHLPARLASIFPRRRRGVRALRERHVR